MSKKFYFYYSTFNLATYYFSGSNKIPQGSTFNDSLRKIAASLSSTNRLI